MHSRHTIVLGILATACAGILAGCPTRPNPDAAGLDCDHATHICVGTLSISSPGPVAHTNGTIMIQVAASPPNSAPSAVEIRRDGVALATVAPPFSYSWDTRNDTEGSHQIDAIANVGGETIMAKAVTIWVDRTPPSIATRTPAQNASNVALSDPVQVVFSEALDPSTVSNVAVSVSSGGSTLSATSSLGSDGKTINVTLGAYSTLSFPATITAAVNPTIKDLAGNPVVSASWSWSAPLWVKLPRLSADQGSLALDATGRASVVYRGVNGTSLSVAQYAAGSVWDFGLGSPTTSYVSKASIAVGPDGTPVVAWSGDHVRAARWNGTSWESLGGNIETVAPAESPVEVSSLAANSSGALVVGWAGGPGPATDGFVAAWSNSTWNLLPAGESAGSGGPILRVDSAGNPLGVFPGVRGSVAALVKKYQGGEWVSLTGSGNLLGIAIDSKDRSVIASEVFGNPEEFVLEVQTSPSLQELTPVLSTDNAGALGFFQLAVTAAGNPVVLWAQESGSTYSLHVARFDGVAWDTTFGVLSGVAGGNGNVRSGELALDPLGAPTVEWSETDQTSSTVSVYVWKSNH